MGENPAEPRGSPGLVATESLQTGKGRWETGCWEAQRGVVFQKMREGSISLWEEDRGNLDHVRMRKQGGEMSPVLVGTLG